MRENNKNYNFPIITAAYFLLWILAPYVSSLPQSIGLPVLAAASTFIFMSIQIGIVYQIAKLRLSALGFVYLLLISILLIIILAYVVCVRLGIIQMLGRYPKPQELLMLVSSGMPRMIFSFLIILLFTSIGGLVSVRVKDKNLLLPIVMFAAYIDLWTVTKGPVAAVLQKAPGLVEAVSAPIPHLGKIGFQPLSVVGPGDFLFLGLVFAAVHRLNMNGKKNYWFIFLAMALGMLLVVFGVFPYIPALIVLSAAVVAANYKEFKLSKEEKISTAIVGIVLAASLPLVWYLIRKMYG